jgi:hypothetical protein
MRSPDPSSTMRSLGFTTRMDAIFASPPPARRYRRASDGGSARMALRSSDNSRDLPDRETPTSKERKILDTTQPCIRRVQRPKP